MKERIKDRRFGLLHNQPCHVKGTLTCSIWECQKAGECQRVPTNGEDMAKASKKPVKVKKAATKFIRKPTTKKASRKAA